MQRLTLVQQFMLASLLVLVGSILGVGWWIGRQIQHGVVHRTAATTALYVDSFVAPYLQDLVHAEALSPEQIASLRDLLQNTPLGQQREVKPVAATGQSQESTELELIQRLLRQALDDMRTLAAGLRLPKLAHLTLLDTLLRVVRGHEQHTRTRAALPAHGLPQQVALSVKITLYHLIQEALYNAFRHGGGLGQQVRVTCAEETLTVHVADQGPGFEWAKVESQTGHLGLVGMRERVESLGGRFHIETEPGQGTTVIAQVPLATGEGEDYE